MKHHDGIRSYDASATAVAFPLGGIGTGNISLGTRGDLRDWEIFNRPDKGNWLPNTFFALRVQVGDADPVARVLEAQIQPPYTLSHGYHPSMNAGLPRFKHTEFHGEYPFASVTFGDPRVPLHIQFEAFTPLIPLEPEDSGIPCAVLTYTVENPTDEPAQLTLVGSLTNPVGNLKKDEFHNMALAEIGQSVNEYRDAGIFRGLYMHNDQIEASHHAFGNLAFVTDHKRVTVHRGWKKGDWWDYLQHFWDDLIDDGLLTDSGEDDVDQRLGTGSLGLVDELAAGESKSYRFLLTWFFPNRPNTWDPSLATGLGIPPETIATTRNHYATRFSDAWNVAEYLSRELPRLEAATRQFHEALFGSTLPPAVIDAVSANIVPLRSTTCFWLEDGRFYGWEGCFDDKGCCYGTCTHVWAYAYTLAYLFPSLEREMRKIEFEIETEPSGFMHFRSLATFHSDALLVSNARSTTAACDGQMGSILRAYREWLLSGDRAYLEAIWPGVKRALGFAALTWDPDDDGILNGSQHNTYDIEFYGPNPLSTIYYLGALRAVEQLAGVMNEPDLALRCRERFERGSRAVDELLWNGEYYIQQLDDVNTYKYQHGIGCLADQLLGQLHATVLGLGHLVDGERVRATVKSIFDHNFKADLSGVANCQRTYALNDEAGLLLCTWPHRGRPRLPMVYADEVWTGVEYQVAAHLIFEGWVAEGTQVVQAVRDRHDGVRRNPWNEVECGNHYARSMSSWAVLLALSGMHCDSAEGVLSFAPAEILLDGETPFRTFWSSGTAWGVLRQEWAAEAGEWRYYVDVMGGDLEGVSVDVRRAPPGVSKLPSDQRTAVSRRDATIQ